ncbi:5-hydroxytryptamine receptor-like [Diachasma alloeum]|uniref:5-hydroxytryptamine receptor-like n=1 Tax=Diachasma alloeum TaxID=454923 RepID=UPI0010FBA21C|nr:5-hydroxytryptamine receptor-like [Diachasma alloeum]
MPGLDMSSVNNAGSLASTSIFEENMSTLVDWSPSANITSSLTVPSSTPLPSSSSSSPSPSPSSVNVTGTTELNIDQHETVGGRGGRLTTTNCPSSLYHCNEDQVTDSLIENQEDSEQGEDEGYASGDESGNIDDDIFIEVSSIGGNEEELRYVSAGTDIGEDPAILFGFDDDFSTMEELLINASVLNRTDNITDNNDTYIVSDDSLFPSGYSLLQIILASIAATILMIAVIVGNVLVIIAIATEKALKNITYWFIASLAVADFCLGLFIMPFSLANEIMGYWIFPYWWCDIHSAMDVLLCTSSIMNLCLISLDRYWSITKAVDYLRKRTPARAVTMIALVWLLSGLVCIPPLLGWKRPRVEEEYPKCMVSRFVCTSCTLTQYIHINFFIRPKLSEKKAKLTFHHKCFTIYFNILSHYFALPYNVRTQAGIIPLFPHLSDFPRFFAQRYTHG